MDLTTVHAHLAMWSTESSGTNLESLRADISRVLENMNVQGLTPSKSQLEEWSEKLGLEIKETDTANEMRRKIYEEINNRMENGLREQAGGTKKPRKVTQKPKVKSTEGMESRGRRTRKQGKPPELRRTRR